MLELSGYLKGQLGAEEQLSLISGCSDLRRQRAPCTWQVSGGHLPAWLAGPVPWVLGSKAGEGVGFVSTRRCGWRSRTGNTVSHPPPTPAHPPLPSRGWNSLLGC